jgi:hypothetical protein
MSTYRSCLGLVCVQARACATQCTPCWVVCRRQTVGSSWLQVNCNATPVASQ